MGFIYSLLSSSTRFRIIKLLVEPIDNNAKSLLALLIMEAIKYWTQGHASLSIIVLIF